MTEHDDQHPDAVYGRDWASGRWVGTGLAPVLRFNRCPRCGVRISPPSAAFLRQHMEFCKAAKRAALLPLNRKVNG